MSEMFFKNIYKRYCLLGIAPSMLPCEILPIMNSGLNYLGKCRGRVGRDRVDIPVSKPRYVRRPVSGALPFPFRSLWDWNGECHKHPDQFEIL